MSEVSDLVGRTNLEPTSHGFGLRVTIRASHSLLEIEAWMPSEIKAISPLMDRLMQLIEGSQCVAGEEPAVQVALREALNNSVVHGNGTDARKLVHVRCRCELGKGSPLSSRTKGKGLIQMRFLIPWLSKISRRMGAASS